MCWRSYFVFLRASKQMCERLLHVSCEPGSENILFRSELMTRLPNDRINDIQSGNFVVRLALEDELFHRLDDVLVELNGFHRRLCDCAHLRLRDRNLVVVERKELKNSIEPK